MANKFKLSSDELEKIQEGEEQHLAALAQLERAKQFKEGDYLIRGYRCRNVNGEYIDKIEWQKNSYGFHTKYQVVHTTASGRPFAKELNHLGKPQGYMQNLCHVVDEYGEITETSGAVWELDPEYVDAMLLEQEYDPLAGLNTKKAAYREVLAHNKAAKVKTKEIGQVVDFFKTVKVGDTLWTSPVSFLHVQEIKTVSKRQYSKVYNNRLGYFDDSYCNIEAKGPYIQVLTVVNKRGTVKEVIADDFQYKALYTERPRKYKELNL